MTVKGLTKKQLIMILERDIRNDNCCITEDDMYWLMKNSGDTYDAEIFHGEILYTLKGTNPEWDNVRMFLPREGDVLKGLRS